METLFNSVIDSSVTVTSFLICTAASIVSGLIISLCYTRVSDRYTGSFVTTLAILPAIIQVVIMMVNGNIGTGVAVAGAFSLVRFRSIPGTAKEIGFIFISLAAGLSLGMGYIAYGVLFTLILCFTAVILKALAFGEKAGRGKKLLTVVIPESLDYTSVFDNEFSEYLKKYELRSVKTTNMGSLFKLKYEIVLNSDKKEKEFIDALRCKNGNLEIICSTELVNNEIL